MPGSSRAVFAPSDCSCHSPRLNSSTTRSRMPTKIDVLGARVLELIQPQDHFAPMQPVGAAQILLAGAIGKRFGLLLGPAKRKPVIAVRQSTKIVSY